MCMYGFYKTPSTFQVLALPFTIVETKKHAIRRQTQRYVIVQLQEKAIITKNVDMETAYLDYPLSS
jgi:hypothetical protein